MLSCINLSIELLDKKIFSNVSLSLLPGAIYILKGANGSGKTSLLKTIAGINDNYQGEILWNNKSIEKEIFLAHIVSYMGHENALKEDLSVIDNLSLWADFKGNQLLIAPAVVQFGLTEHLEKKCKYLSAGLKKRVALARMIISNGIIWLLDEPESNLDDKGIELLLKLLQAKINSGGIVIIASHNLEHYKKIPLIKIEDLKMINKLLRLSLFEVNRNLLQNKTWLSNSLFLFINMLVFPFAITTDIDSYSIYFLPSIITSTLLAIVLITNNVFDEDAKDGTLDQLRVFGVPIYIIYLSKVIAGIVEFSFVICVVLPVMAVLYKIDIKLALQVLSNILFSIPLLTSVSIFGAMLTMNVSKNSAIAVLLIFPLLISGLIILSLASAEILNGADFLVAFSYIKINIGLTLFLLPILIWLSKYLKQF